MHCPPFTMIAPGLPRLVILHQAILKRHGIIHVLIFFSSALESKRRSSAEFRFLTLHMLLARVPKKIRTAFIQVLATLTIILLSFPEFEKIVTTVVPFISQLGKEGARPSDFQVFIEESRVIKAPIRRNVRCSQIPGTLKCF